jgi:epsilon-lactone hydrolase
MTGFVSESPNMASLRAEFVKWLLKRRVRNLLPKSGFNVEIYRKRFANETSHGIRIPSLVKLIETFQMGIPTTLIEPFENKSQFEILFFHGGGFLLPVQKGHLEFASELSLKFQTRVHIPHYRLAPEHPFPAAFEDCWGYYQSLLSSTSKPILMVGDSAGGNLALAVTKQATLQRLPAPIGLVLISPVTGHLMNTTKSFTDLPQDLMFDTSTFEYFSQKYAPNDSIFTDLRIAPLREGLKGFPPLFITASMNEALYEDSVALVRQAQNDQISFEFYTEPDLFHVFPLLWYLPETRKARIRIEEFIVRHST